MIGFEIEEYLKAQASDDGDTTHWILLFQKSEKVTTHILDSTSTDYNQYQY
jgi:hypothetical protein